jgi:glutathione-regulated potassium-efflux system ancillary protein KefC
LVLDLYSTALISIVVVIAGIASIKLNFPSAIIEIILGILLGNFLGVGIEPWLDFLGTFGGLMLTFLAGTEVDLTLLANRSKKQSFTLGVVAFTVPLAVEMIFLDLFTDWSFLANLAISLAMTSAAVAVVYTLLLDAGLLGSNLSKLILAATFVNDFLTLIAINLLSHTFNIFTIAFLLAIPLMLWGLPKLLAYLVASYGRRSVEIELRFIFAIMLTVSFLADAGKMQAIFGAFILGLLFANSIQSYDDLLPKLRSVTFSLFSPAFFIRAGLLISLPVVLQNIPLILTLLGMKMVSKFVGTYPLCRRWVPEAATFSSMLLMTGLTIGIITLTFGKDMNFLNQTQFSIAMVSVILSAIIPALIAKKFIPNERFLLKAR